MTISDQKRRTRARKTKDPCRRCFLHKERCICISIPSLSLRTRIALIVHHKELLRTSNTGRLAIEALTNSEMITRGESVKHQTLRLDHLINSNYHSWLFFPSSDAQELTPELVRQYSDLPIQLIVPDGNWRQASKVNSRHAEFKNLMRVKISTPNTATLHLRKESTEAGMATLEAIAHALGIIEGIDIKEKLMHLYWRKLEETFKGRGFQQLLLQS